jgi:hypothetical protein
MLSTAGSIQLYSGVLRYENGHSTSRKYSHTPVGLLYRKYSHTPVSLLSAISMQLQHINFHTTKN